MPQAAGIAAVIGAATSVVGTIQSNKAQKRSARAQAAQQKLQEQRSRRQQIREFQISRARALATAQGAGALQGSGVSGGVQGLSSQLGANLGFQSQFGNLSDIVTANQQKAINAQSLAGFGVSLFNFGVSNGGFSQIKQKLQPRQAPTQVHQLPRI